MGWICVADARWSAWACRSPSRRLVRRQQRDRWQGPIALRAPVHDQGHLIPTTPRDDDRRGHGMVDPDDQRRNRSATECKQRGETGPRRRDFVSGATAVRLRAVWIAGLPGSRLYSIAPVGRQAGSLRSFDLCRRPHRRPICSPGDAEVVRLLRVTSSQCVNCPCLAPTQNGVRHSPRDTMSSGTACVMPRIVSSTSPLNVVAPVRSLKRPAKLILGWFATSRKWRCVDACRAEVACPDPGRSICLRTWPRGCIPIETTAADVL